VLGAGVMIATVIKRCQRRRVVEVMRRVLAGSEAEVISRMIATQRSMLALINTAYIERLQATFRARLAPVVRRTRAGAHKHCTLEAGMWLVGSCYDFLWAHRSLGEGHTPAMAAGLTDHRWSMEELLTRLRCHPPKCPDGVGENRSGCWRPRMQPDHGSMRCYPQSQASVICISSASKRTSSPPSSSMRRMYPVAAPVRESLSTCVILPRLPA
jgi:hypothetical protein